MSREIMQQALDALKLHLTHHEHKCVYLNPVMYALEAELAKPEQEEPLPLVDIGVDVTPEGTHVVACYNRPDAVQEMFYSQFHPLAKPEQATVPFPFFIKKRIEEAIDLAIKPKGMSVHDGKASVYASDLQRMLLVVELAAQQLAKPEQNKPLRLSSMYEYGHIHDASQPEPEPVAWMTNSEHEYSIEYKFNWLQTPLHDIPLYALEVTK